MSPGAKNGELRDAKRLGRTGPPKTAIRFVSFLPIWPPLCRLQYEAAVRLLHRTRIHGIELGEGSDVGIRHLDRLGKQEPVDGLAAGRRGERSGIAVVTACGRQEGVRIDPASALTRAFAVGHGRTRSGIEHGIGPAGRDHHADRRVEWNNHVMSVAAGCAVPVRLVGSTAAGRHTASSSPAPSRPPRRGNP